MKTASLLVVVVLLAAAVGLAATNPTTEQYTVFLEGSLTQALNQMDQSATPEGTTPEKKLLRDLLKAQGTKVIQSLTRTNTIRRNFGLFSIFETTAFGVRIQVLGIARQFVPLEDEKALVRKLGQVIL